LKTLIVSAHPDDEILGCGGMALKLTDCYSLVLNKGGRENAILTDKVAGFMGFKGHWQFDFPDNKFDTVPLLEIIRVVEGIKNEIKPQVVFTHFEHDLNIDHKLTYQAVMTACRPIAGESVKEIYSFEIPSSTEWNFPRIFAPNIFVDIENTIDKKIEAFKMYESEVRNFPHPRSPEALRVIAKRWGVVSGLKAAEAFLCVRQQR
jgi:LmbE family N-acetylglucosaminyl deacetylase